LWEDVGDLVDYITRTVQKIKLWLVLNNT
jgi:hypothetical protein